MEEVAVGLQRLVLQGSANHEPAAAVADKAANRETAKGCSCVLEQSRTDLILEIGMGPFLLFSSAASWLATYSAKSAPSSISDFYNTQEEASSESQPPS